MIKKHPLLTGTLILTLTGVVTKIMGFFYKIFLSRTIGAEGLGIYQMIFPIFGICFSLTTAGIETSISRFVAEESARNNPSGSRRILASGLILSVSLSLIAALCLYGGAEFLATSYLKEPRCIDLLRFLALSLPFASCHACISGYYYGRKQTGIPAASQLIEQVIRVVSVFLLASICTEKGISLSPVLAVLGLVMGEFASALFCITAFSSKPAFHPKAKVLFCALSSDLKKLLTMSVPLTANRVVVNILASLEALLIPLTLKAYGLSSTAAYSIYGTLTGMSLSFILFPTVLTGSVSVLLLPSVSESAAAGDRNRIRSTLKKAMGFCLPFGSFCTIFFLLTGHLLGTFFFDSTLAGDFIQTLAWICPFLYLNATLNSILHGLGRTSLTFRNNLLGITVRICFILLCIPRFGIVGYLWGLLANQLLVSFLCICSLKDYLR
ncbi:MAG: polysaccharide biosynthesis protein [Lachnospiraceae bacterium]|nr:polysaccharide biosynthesis protein [Lachnospiraceae bacterium]